MVIIMYPIINYFIYGNYNVPYYNAADQCIRLSPKMASFVACVAGVRKGRGRGDKERMEGEGTTPSPFTPAMQATSFAAENTQDNVFLLVRSKDKLMEFRIEGNKSREYSTAEKK